MKIQSISQQSCYNLTKKNLVKNEICRQSSQKENITQPSFKGTGGGVFGFMTGGAAGLALTALALTNPVGWAGLALYAGTAAGSVVGAAVGSKLGDIVDPDEEKKKP